MAILYNLSSKSLGVAVVLPYETLYIRQASIDQFRLGKRECTMEFLPYRKDN